MKAYLDGILIVNPSETLQNPSLTLRRQTETGDIGFSFTGDLIFTGAEYTYLYATLVSAANALVNKVTLKFINDCCGTAQVYEFSLTSKGLKWCEGKCEINAAAVEKTTAEEKLTCLKNTLIWDNYAGFKSKQHPRMSYCNELRPNWMHDVMIILFIATATSLLMFIPVIGMVSIIFNAYNGVVSWLNSNLGTSFNQLTFAGSTTIDLSTFQNLVNQLTSFITGCGRKHPSPLVRDYATNVCGKCGLTFNSSIFNSPTSPYYNLVYVNAPINKGTTESDTTTYWIEENRPILNGTRFFDQIKLPFNAEWKINGNNLYLERRDYFIPTTPWLDLTTYAKVNSVCWSWSAKTRYSYGSFYYQKDGINWVGSEAVSRWGDIVEWNNPYSNLQKDELTPLVPFAACRFRDDGIDRDVLSAYEWLPTVGAMIQKYKRSMIMNSHNCFTPMLLIWDGVDVSNGKVDGGSTYFSGYYDPSGSPVAGNQFYNYPMWFDESVPGNLYTNFWYIENPKLSGFLGKDFTAEVIFDCDLLDVIDLDGLIQTSLGPGKINEITLNFATNLMQISGTI